MDTTSTDERDKQLDKIYYNPQDPGSYGGVNRLLKRAKEVGIPEINLSKVRDYLRDQNAYTLHKPARKHFTRNRTITGAIDKQWQADLADMQSLASSNSGYKYILTVIDIFSKYAWAIPVKSKSSKDMLVAFETLFKKAGPRRPERLQTDAGKEFLNKEVQALFKQKNIHHFFSGSDQKAAVVERFNRTLKGRIWTYFTAHQEDNYIDLLDKLVNAYNHSTHRSIGMRPADVQKKDEPKLFNKMFGDDLSKVRSTQTPPLKEGQMVRVSKVKGAFEKGYMPNWSLEHFIVSKVNDNSKRRVYKLQDFENEDISGNWYEDEIQPIRKNLYLIEKVLRTRKPAKGEKELFIKWEGWPTKFNSWIKESDIDIYNRPKPK